MSAGDIISDIQVIAGGARLTFQPAGSTEYIIFGAASLTWLGVAPNQGYEMTASIYDGVNETVIAEDDNDDLLWIDWKVIIDNTNYMRLLNNNAGNNRLGYWGIQTKN
jgi:hypothetical protein